MPDPIRLLFAGESWMTHSVHVKGFDSFETSSYHEGGTELIAALRASGIDVTYMPSHVAAGAFPLSAQELAGFDAVLLSDIGANTLLLPDRVFVRSERGANRLALLRDFVRAGGGLLMVGGYLTFQGIAAKGNYRGTPVEEVLPVQLLAGDDRHEAPEGLLPTIAEPDHPVLAGLSDWPAFLGYNRSLLHPEATLVASIDGDPLIAVRNVGRGRSAVFSSDCGPHWGPPEFVAWPGYGRLWTNLVAWIAGR
jgi:uncharacterized membrane protein